MVFLATLSYSRHAEQDVVETLLALATLPRLKELRAPDFTVFDLKKGYRPQKDVLMSMARRASRKLYECPERYISRLPGEYQDDFEERQEDTYVAAKERSGNSFANALMRQWPVPEGSFPENDDCDIYISPAIVMREVKPYLFQLYSNLQFRNYIDLIQPQLDYLSPIQAVFEKYTFSTPLYEEPRIQRSIHFIDLFANPAPDSGQTIADNFDATVLQEFILPVDQAPVARLLQGLLADCTGGYERNYIEDLQTSLQAFRQTNSVELKMSQDALDQFLQEVLQQRQAGLDSAYETLCQHLTLKINRITRTACSTPRLSPTTLLSYLRMDKIHALSDEWRKSLVRYATSILKVQHAERLFGSSKKHADLFADMKNPGRKGWDPFGYPEWLLFEIENNIQIRQEQAEIAAEMISPSSKSNAIMQLNMGLGKSSVIVPIVATTLADRAKLVRVVVLKSLSQQIFHSLSSKLGNLLNRRVFYMPISRALELNAGQAHSVLTMYKSCMDCGGILLVQPEHILLFELMGIDRLLAGDDAGGIIVGAQRWLTEHARDILDESDEILSVKFELIYTMGCQRAIEFSPVRWNTIEHILGLIAKATADTSRQYPNGLEIFTNEPGSFPRIRIIEKEAGDNLLNKIASQICEFGTPEIPLWKLPFRLRSCLVNFVTNPDMTKDAAQPLEHLLTENASTQKGLLLLRGIFAFGVIRFTLSQKRWRVNYGLDLSRTMLAVPYTAKDIPAARAEFSHPDAAIILTCLSYYYGGLSNNQLMTAFEALIRLDNSQSEYEKWTDNAPELPEMFRQMSSINLSNLGECHSSIFPRLRFAKGAIDFNLSHIVFPKQMKEFPHKLSFSGWDIAKEKKHPTTGFSGTNDSRYVLPLTITQRDLPQLLSTNALILDQLLRSENYYYDIQSNILDARLLLRTTLQLDPPARVILDAGAQVLELGNEAVASEWLELCPKETTLAAVFFNVSGDLSVLSRDGSIKRLQDSSFANQLDRCVIYLDQAHTRGTDLKLPTYYRALVTLGPGLDKDHIAQGRCCHKKSGWLLI
jgi:hypothetical protein